ncbi:MAG: hypothetical protein AAF311_06800 [Pseudomonadota bacterium]
MTDLYTWALFLHILLYVFWLGGDLGVAVLGGQFRKREDYTLDQRLALLKVLVMVDMGPRTAWALMVGSSITLAHLGSYWVLPGWALALAWIVSAGWLYLVWAAYKAGQTPRAAKLRKIEMILKWALAAGYLYLGFVSLVLDDPIVPDWLAWKAFLFGLIFIAAIMIDVRFKPVGPALMTLIEKGSADETELPLRAVMDRSRFWVRVTYVLLVIIGFMGTSKFL